MPDTNRYDGKYGTNTVSWDNKNPDDTIKQYNVKDIDTGDHYFVNTETGRMGTALGDYRPFRENSDKK